MFTRATTRSSSKPATARPGYTRNIANTAASARSTSSSTPAASPCVGAAPASAARARPWRRGRLGGATSREAGTCPGLVSGVVEEKALGVVDGLGGRGSLGPAGQPQQEKRYWGARSRAQIAAAPAARAAAPSS